MKKEKEVLETIEIVKSEFDGNQKKMVVFDEESGKSVDIEKDFQEESWNAHNMILEDFKSLSTRLFQFKERKYYLGMGFSSYNEYCASYQIGRKNAHRHAVVGQRITGVLKSGEDVSTSRQSGEDVSTSTHDIEKRIASIGFSKLYELSRLGQNLFNEMFETGSVSLDGGASFTYEDLRNMPAKEVAKKITSIKDPKSRKEINKLKADIALLKEEKKVLLSREADWEKKVRAAEQLENMYGKTDATLKGVIKSLNMAHQSLGDFFRYLNKSGVTAEHPAVVLEMLSTILGSFHQYGEQNMAEFELILKQAEGVI